MTLRYRNRPLEQLPYAKREAMGRVFRALDAALKEEGFEVYYDDRAENLVDEIVLFTQGKN